MKPIVHSVKHQVQMTLTSVTTASINNVLFAKGVESTLANLVTEVEEGANVKAVFIELWLIAQTNNQFFTITLEKVEGQAGLMTIAQSADLFSYPNKKNVLYTTQGLAPNDGVGQPIRVIYQWFKIPKGKQRWGLNDRLQLNVASRGDGTIDFCGFALYKELS